MLLSASAVTIERIKARAYTIPTDLPESDGTITWDSTTLVIAHAQGGGKQGTGYSYKRDFESAWRMGGRRHEDGEDENRPRP